MDKKTDKLMIFTVNACPMGRSMATVLREVADAVTSLSIEYVYIDEDVATTNTYCVKENPTLLLINKQGQELTRFSGFKETEEVLRLIDDVERSFTARKFDYEANTPILETYTIYHSKNGTLSPVKIEHLNPTSVRTPRITAVQLLIHSRVEGYDNPFPLHISFEFIKFQDNIATIFLESKAPIEESVEKLMSDAAKLTLSHFGIEGVNLQRTVSEQKTTV